MKSERRHELEHNELATWLANIIKQVEPYSKVLLLGALLVVLTILLVNWWGQTSGAGAAKAWDEYHAAFNSDSVIQLEDLAEANKDASVGQWSALAAGNFRLNTGTQMMFTKRADAIQELRKALEMYDLALASSRADAIRERALFGRARAYETLAGSRQSEGELDKAIADYKTLVETYPKSASALMAKHRLADLESKATREFYDKFAQYTPPTPDAKALPDVPGLNFDNPNLLPEGSLGPGLPAAPSMDEKPAAEKPAAETDLPPLESPKAEAPKTEAPKAETPKPEAPKDEPAK